MNGSSVCARATRPQSARWRIEKKSTTRTDRPPSGTVDQAGQPAPGVGTDFWRSARLAKPMCHRTPMVTSLLGRSRQIKCTGRAGPGANPLGTPTFTWFRPGNPGASPKNKISAIRPPMATRGGIALPDRSNRFPGFLQKRRGRGPKRPAPSPREESRPGVRRQGKRDQQGRGRRHSRTIDFGAGGRLRPTSKAA